MNILIVVPWYKPTIGGVVLYIEKLSKVLTDRGHTIKIIVPGDNNRITLKNHFDSIPVYAFNMRSFYSGKRLIRALGAFVIYFWSTLMELRKFIRKNKIDMILISYPSGYEFYFAILRRISSIKYVVIIHGSEINLLAQEPWPTRFGVNVLIGSSDGLVAVSSGLLKQAQATFKRLPGISRVIYMGIEEQWKNSRYSPYIVDGKYILTLAWAAPVKGPDIAIRAFAIIKDKYPDVKLVMVGSGPMEDELCKLIEELSLLKRIIRLGTVEPSTLPPVFERALFGIIPSRQEGFGVVALEFQLLKKAVIASDVGGLPEFVSDNYNGILVPPGDPEILAEKMSLLLDNPDLCRKLGENGYQRVVSSFTLEKTGVEFCGLFDEITPGQIRRSRTVNDLGTNI
jgi:glycosyltransferase involved in cell wall biosynthesis